MQDRPSKKGNLPREGSFLQGKRHTISPQEKRSFVEHVNKLLKDEPDLKDILPIDPASNEIFHAVQSGILLAHLVNRTVPGSVDMSKIEKKKIDIKKGGKFNVINNHNVTLESLRSVGVKVINVSAEDLILGQDILVMGLLWQIVQKGLSLQMQEALHGDLKDETKNMNEREILLYWMNKHLKAGGYNKTVTNFTSDISDAKAYAILLEQVCPAKCSKKDAMKAKDDLDRATIVLNLAEKVDAKKFVQPEDIVSGNGNLNYAFVANLFQKFANVEVKNLDDSSSSSSSDSEHEKEAEKEVGSSTLDRIRQLEETIQKLQSKLEESEENYHQHESDLLKRIKELEAENRKLKEELEEERRRKEREEEEKRRKGLDSENDKDMRLAEQERDMNKLREENDKLSKRLRDNEKEAKGKADVFDEMAERLRELEEREEERERNDRKRLLEEGDKDGEIEKLKKRISALENENERLEATLVEYDNELKDLKAREWVRKKAEVEKTDSYLQVRYEALKNDVVIEGYLVKLANHGNKWKKRYFVLRDNYLFYFQSKESDKKGAKFIRLKTAQIIDKGVEGKRQQVVVIKPKKGNRSYKIDFESSKQKDKWLEKMLAAAGTEKLDASALKDDKKEKRKSWFARRKEEKTLKEQAAKQSPRKESPRKQAASASQLKKAEEEKDSDAGSSIESSSSESESESSSKKSNSSKKSKGSAAAGAAGSKRGDEGKKVDASAGSKAGAAGSKKVADKSVSASSGSHSTTASAGSKRKNDDSKVVEKKKEAAPAKPAPAKKAAVEEKKKTKKKDSSSDGESSSVEDSSEDEESSEEESSSSEETETDESSSSAADAKNKKKNNK